MSKTVFKRLKLRKIYLYTQLLLASYELYYIPIVQSLIRQEIAKISF